MLSVRLEVRQLATALPDCNGLRQKERGGGGGTKRAYKINKIVQVIANVVIYLQRNKIVRNKDRQP